MADYGHSQGAFVAMKHSALIVLFITILLAFLHGCSPEHFEDGSGKGQGLPMRSLRADDLHVAPEINSLIISVFYDEIDSQEGLMVRVSAGANARLLGKRFFRAGEKDKDFLELAVLDLLPDVLFKNILKLRDERDYVIIIMRENDDLLVQHPTYRLLRSRLRQVFHSFGFRATTVVWMKDRS